jgi:hypothetical protein
MVCSLNFLARYVHNKLKSLIREFQRMMACPRACHKVAQQFSKNSKLLISLIGKLNSCTFPSAKKFGKRWKTICGCP